MPSLTGNLSTNKLTLQAHGNMATSNFVMEVKDSAFTMSMGDEVLLTCAPEGVGDVNASSTDTGSLLTISRSTNIVGTLTVNGAEVPTYTASIANNMWYITKGSSDFTTAIYEIMGGDATGETSDGADYKIIVPPNFNGTVAMYSHGYRFRFALPNIALLAYPSVNYTPPPQAGPLNSSTREEEFLLAQGVAVISSGFSRQGWNPDVAVPTNHELLGIFKTLYPQTNKVMVWGDSLGAHISQAYAETYPNEVDSVGLFDMGYNIGPLADFATDALLGYLSIFGDGGYIDSNNTNWGNKCRVSGYSNHPALPTDTLVQSSIATILTTLNYLVANATTAPLVWPSGLGNVGVALSNAGIPPSAAFHVLGAAMGLPNRSPHYGGSNLPIASNLLYASAIIENFGASAALAVNAIADLELQLGGTIASNAGTVYSSRSNNFDSNQFDYMLAYGVSSTTLITTVLGALDAYGTKMAGACNVKLYDSNVITQLHGRINKPTVVMCADSDPVTIMANNRQLVIDYNSNVNIGLATSNMLQVLISPAPTYAYSYSQTAPAVLGTGHANFTSNNYTLAAALMLYGANTGSILTGAKLAAGITTTENMINGIDVINTDAYDLYY